MTPACASPAWSTPRAWTSDDNLKAHLGSPDFFDVERTPEIRFESSELRIADDGSVIVDGELTLKGHTETVEATGTIGYIEADIAGGERVGVELETIVDAHEVRPELERAAAQGRLRTGERRQARRPPRVHQGVLVMRVLGISGSLRRDSHNLALLRAAADALPPGAELEILEGWPTCRPTTRTTTSRPLPRRSLVCGPRSRTPTRS